MLRSFILVGFIIIQAHTLPEEEYNASDFEQVHLDKRIVGGTDHENKEYPWVVSIMKFIAPLDDSRPYYEQVCNGFLINPQWVMTAAYCVTSHWGESERIAADKFKVEIVEQVENIDNNCVVEDKVDEFVDKEVEIEWYDYKVKSIHIPDGYTRATPVDDIALLRLNAPADMMDAAIMPILPNTDEDMPLEGQGDDGAPMMCDDKQGINRVVGIVSSGHRGSRYTHAAVFTRVSRLRNWIDTVMRG